MRMQTRGVSSRKKLVIVMYVLLLIAAGAVAFWLSQRPNREAITADEQKYPAENGHGNYDQKNIDSCATADIPKAELDTTLDAASGIAIIRWWDAASQENKELRLPYEPNTGFAGCSPSAKTVLEHIRAAQIQMP